MRHYLQGDELAPNNPLVIQVEVRTGGNVTVDRFAHALNVTLTPVAEGSCGKNHARPPNTRSAGRQARQDRVLFSFPATNRQRWRRSIRGSSLQDGTYQIVIHHPSFPTLPARSRRRPFDAGASLHACLLGSATRGSAMTKQVRVLGQTLKQKSKTKESVRRQQ